MTAAKFHTVLTTGDEHGNVLTTVDMQPAGSGTGSMSGTVFPAAEPIRITVRVARRLLREVVADFGRHHSIGKNACAYMWQGCPTCMVGCALHQAGVSEDELAGMDRETPTVIGVVKTPARLQLTAAARVVFEAAQAKQDEGLSWGAALDAALAVRPWQRLAVAA